DLPFEVWRTFIDQTLEFIGPHHLIVSGGEPLTSPYVVDVIRHCSKNGISTAMVTNGWLLERPMLQALLEAKLSALIVSLDVPGPAHDEVRNKPGLYRRIREALDFLAGRKGGMNLNLMAVIAAHNLEHLESLVRFAHEHPAVGGVRFQCLAQPFFSEPDRFWYRTNPLWPKDSAAVDRAMDRLLALKDQGLPIVNERYQIEYFKHYFRDPNLAIRQRCVLGEFKLQVRSDGLMSPCMYHGVMGDIRTQHVRDIWYSEQARKLRRAMLECPFRCNMPLNCDFESNMRQQYGNRQLRMDEILA
ncbi:MAG: hypothetical protein A2284_08785, partial [Deltaproteobacteria bacterium RIFOXYA12_FULL_61_11]